MIGLIIHTDGGSRGNPGEGAVGVVIETKDQVIKGSNDQKGTILTEFGKAIGIVTNNEAEYQAVIYALEWVKNNITIKQYNNISFFMDSKLVCEQLNGRWKIKQDHLRKLFTEVKRLEVEIGVPVSYTHVLRDKNKRADELLNQVLDTA